MYIDRFGKLIWSVKSSGSQRLGNDTSWTICRHLQDRYISCRRWLNAKRIRWPYFFQNKITGAHCRRSIKSRCEGNKYCVKKHWQIPVLNQGLILFNFQGSSSLFFGTFFSLNMHNLIAFIICLFWYCNTNTMALIGRDSMNLGFLMQLKWSEKIVYISATWCNWSDLER